MEERVYRSRLAEIPSNIKKWISRYNFESEELQSMAQNTPQVIHSELIDLSVAQPFNNPKIVKVPGRAVCIYGVTTATAHDPVANTGIETNVTTVMILARFNKLSNDVTAAIPLKHNRGFRGDFTEMYLSWPAQASNSARLIIYKFDEMPWQTGETST